MYVSRNSAFSDDQLTKANDHLAFVCDQVDHTSSLDKQLQVHRKACQGGEPVTVPVPLETTRADVRTRYVPMAISIEGLAEKRTVGAYMAARFYGEHRLLCYVYVITYTVNRLVHNLTLSTKHLQAHRPLPCTEMIIGE